MEVPVELNKNRQTASIVFAGQQDFGFLAGWREKLGNDQNPLRTDAVDFAQLVADRLKWHVAYS
jgi:hypothetical protein